MRLGLVIASSLILVPAIAVAQPTAAQQYQALLAEFKEEGGARIFAKRFLELSTAHQDDPVAVEALLWVVTNVRARPDTTRALELLATHHVESPKLGPACKEIAKSRSAAAEKLLRAVIKKNPDKQVQAEASYYLATLLDLEASLVAQLETQPELAPRVLQYYGREYGKHLSSLKLDALAAKRERVYEQILQSFSNVKLSDTTMGDVAEKMLYQIRHLSVGRVAPEIEGQDIQGTVFKLSSYRGKVVMLTFWGHW